MFNIPITFIGNNHLFEIIKNSYLENSLSHSIIIYGEKGIGKATFVRYLTIQIFNKFQNLPEKNTKSNHINLLNSNAHPNYMFIDKEIDEKSKKQRNYIVIEF